MPAPTADVALPVLFNEVTLPEWVTNTQLATLENFQITVVAEAIQADGFAMPAPLGPPSTADFPPVSTAHGLRPRRRNRCYSL